MHHTCRSATYKAQAVALDHRPFTPLTSAMFTKVEHGRDAFACAKAVGGRREGGFFLSSGGDSCGQACPSGTSL